MSLSNKIQYLLALDKARRGNLLAEHEKELIKVYNRAFQDTYGSLKDLRDNTATKNARVAFVKQIYRELEELNDKYLDQVPESVLKSQEEVLTALLEYEKGLSPLGVAFIKKVGDVVKVTSKDILTIMIKGEIYKDGVGLSDRLWYTVNKTGMKIDDAIKSIIAQGKGSVDGAKLLKEFGKNHRVWNTAKVKEKLGPAYASRGPIDYEALRLMRTTHGHLAQLAVMEGAKVNPYMTHVKWHSAHAGGRTCDICLGRDGKVFKLSEVPFDHPNGLCWLESIFTIDGKESSPQDMAEDLRKWINGEPNSGSMDKIYR